MHIKLDLLKNFVKAKDHHSLGFSYLQQNFSVKFKAKLKLVYLLD